ncbi:MAG: CDP-diacylglycerol--serine O-phosphatidyltransferase [Pseudomonadota bacterium]
MSTDSPTPGNKPSPKERLQELPISRVLPNIMTLVALCTGLSAIRFALLDRYEMAVIAILIAAILDAMDGRLARLLGTSSRFGAELDSLSDMINFGVAPSVLLYISSLQQWNGFGWALVLFYVICAGLRLARFNTALDIPQPDWTQGFFTGVPIPAGAFLALMGLMLQNATEVFLVQWPIVHGCLLIFAGLLLVSRLPTYSLKGSRIPQHLLLPLMLLVGLTITALINAFWYTLFVIGLGYVCTFPFSYRAYQRLKDRTHRSSGDTIGNSNCR